MKYYIETKRGNIFSVYAIQLQSLAGTSIINYLSNLNYDGTRTNYAQVLSWVERLPLKSKNDWLLLSHATSPIILSNVRQIWEEN